MKKASLILLLIASTLVANADHITGGEMYYSSRPIGNGKFEYFFTLKLFMRCNSGRQFPDPTIISIFNKGGAGTRKDLSVALSRTETISSQNNNPCITDPPTVCYVVGYYDFSAVLDQSSDGYVIASQVNFRINGISNLNAGQIGATYTCEIPGTSETPTGPSNNSAIFTGSDLVVVCAKNFFTYSFAASDADGDKMRYSFCSAYVSTNQGINGVPPGSPPYFSVPYRSPAFTSTSPLGARVKIDPETGLISGVAPASGIYVVTVCAEEIRNGKVIATQRKDLQINITDCSIAAASLEEDYLLCGLTRSLFINNQSTSPLIVSYDWSVLDPGGNEVYHSNDMNLTYNFQANGTYAIKLIVNKLTQCTDSASTIAYVYPGLNANFNTRGICITKPSTFTDQSTLVTGAINSWTWDFGEPTDNEDVATTPNAQYTYPGLGVKPVTLIVTTTEACRDTLSKNIEIIDKPPITLAFRDTLICINDQLQLQASGIGNFSWLPALNVVNANTATPIVSPQATTSYYVSLETDGCNNRDSVLVRVVDHVSLATMNDTIICQGDPVLLRIVSDGLKYDWTPVNQLSDPTIQQPIALNTNTLTTYNVVATIGGCSARGDITIRPVPYPIANAGEDQLICYKANARLHGVTDGDAWQWSPAATLSNATSLDPVATPTATTAYVFTVSDSRSGCPKPTSDTVFIKVLPKIVPYAGNDTAVIIGQRLQLNASGGEQYLWQPATHLSSATIPNPEAVFNEASEGERYKLYVYNEADCVDSAFITIKVFATMPTVFVPSAFTPNNDGKNDVIFPTAVGMKNIQYFNIYNRWGQLIFSTTVNGRGWDGRVNGQPQLTNSYVWQVKAIDFTGKVYFQKGVFTLIR